MPAYPYKQRYNGVESGDPMSYRFLASVGALAVLLAPLSGQTPDAAAKPATSGKTGAPKSKTAIPRLADGHTDLQGVWTNATITPLVRPTAFKDKATISDA